MTSKEYLRLLDLETKRHERAKSELAGLYIESATTIKYADIIRDKFDRTIIVEDIWVAEDATIVFEGIKVNKNGKLRKNMRRSMLFLDDVVKVNGDAYDNQMLTT